MKNFFSLLLLAALATFTGCQKVSLTGPASVSGNVYEHGTTVPVSGAWVYLISRDYNAALSQGNTVTAIQTDSTGGFSINYDRVTDMSYELQVKHAYSDDLYGTALPDFLTLTDRNMTGVILGLVTTARLSFTMIDTGSTSTLQYFHIFSNYRLRNISKDTSFIGYYKANVSSNFEFSYMYEGTNKRLEYSPKPAPFYAAKGDTLHYTVYF